MVAVSLRWVGGEGEPLLGSKPHCPVSSVEHGLGFAWPAWQFFASQAEFFPFPGLGEAAAAILQKLFEASWFWSEIREKKRQEKTRWGQVGKVRAAPVRPHTSERAEGNLPASSAADREPTSEIRQYLICLPELLRESFGLFP